MSNEVIVFKIPSSFGGMDIRVVTLDGNPWFVVADVCRVLGMVNPSIAVKPLMPAERGLRTFKGRPTNLISETGLYKLVLRAQRANPLAAFLQDWVTQVVLPAIRKTGSYASAEKLSDPNPPLSDLDAVNDQIIALLRRKGEMLEARVAELTADNQKLTTVNNMLTLEYWHADLGQVSGVEAHPLERV
jgi:prophage antirepressor-like protein